MCKTGISCKYEGSQGRIENIRLDKSGVNVVGDFTEKASKNKIVVNINALDFLNKKAEKKAKEIIAPLFKKAKRLKPQKKLQPNYT